MTAREKTVSIITMTTTPRSVPFGTKKFSDVEDTKPGIVKFYNSTKSSVDNLDKLVRNFSSKPKCTRWLYGVSFIYVNVAVIVAMCLKDATNHYMFRKELAYELLMPLMKARAQQCNIRAPLQQSMEMVGARLLTTKLCCHPQSGKPDAPSVAGTKIERRLHISAHVQPLFVQHMPLNFFQNANDYFAFTCL